MTFRIDRSDGTPSKKGVPNAVLNPNVNTTWLSDETGLLRRIVNEVVP